MPEEPKNNKKSARKREKVPGTFERAYKARCYPTRQQAKVLARLFGAKRFLWNWALERKQTVYQKEQVSLSYVQLAKELTQLRRSSDTSWLGELPLVPLQQTLRDLNAAYARFFNGQAKHPRFKRRAYAGSARFQLDQRRTQVDRKAGTVQLDGVGRLRFKVTEDLQGDLLAATVSRDVAGRWFVSFTADRVPALPQQERLVENAVGLDLGVKDLVVTSDGVRTAVSDRLKKKAQRLRRYQRGQARKLRAAMVKAGLDPSKPIPKGKGSLLKKSGRFERQRRRIGKLYARIRDHRSDLIQQATTALVRSYAVIAIEDLNVKGMARGFRTLRRSVANACMGEVRRQLEYKAKWHGCTLIKVGRFFPSSQQCHKCSWRYTGLKLGERTWTCRGCGTVHDRDVNAARSVLGEALRIASLNEYPQVAGNVRSEGASAPSLGTLNRELMQQPALPACARQAAGRRIWRERRHERPRIVGDRRRFNASGAVPTKISQNMVVVRDDQFWPSQDLIGSAAALSALFHDLGKAIEAFQLMLRGKKEPGRNLYRHEWVSARLFQAFCGQDPDAQILERLATESETANIALWLSPERLYRDGLEDLTRNDPRRELFRYLSDRPLASLVTWLILSHHRLPTLPIRCNPEDKIASGNRGKKGRHRIEQFCPHGWHAPNNQDSVSNFEKGFYRITSDWLEPTPLLESVPKEEIASYWQFTRGFPAQDATWRKRVRRAATALLKLVQRESPNLLVDRLQNPFVALAARSALCAGDRHYSRQQDKRTRIKVKTEVDIDEERCAYANTVSGGGLLNQTLTEHLIGVELHTRNLARELRHLSQLPGLQHHRPLLARTSQTRFLWQNQAMDAAAAMRTRVAEQGAFVVNMASTGRGKTIANVKIMNAMADPAQGLRLTCALGLRTLTHQTGKSLLRDLRIPESALAVLVGGASASSLQEEAERAAEATGSASRAPLLPENETVIDGQEEAELPESLKSDPQVVRLLASPVLVCTIDYLMPSTQALRTQPFLAPWFRLLGSDLVLDEPDDFDIADLPALTSLVHLAGVLGRKVLLSTATLLPAQALGLFNAYQAGRRHFSAATGIGDPAAGVPCLWVDEFQAREVTCKGQQEFLAAHNAFTSERAQQLSQEPPKRIGELVAVPQSAKFESSDEVADAFARRIVASAIELHAANHQRDPVSGKHVSVGLVRMANINRMVQVGLKLFEQGAPPGYRFHLLIYHSRFPLLLRDAIERMLDTTLQRQNPAQLFEHACIRQGLEAGSEENHLFIVLGSPVTEVGRDHDYDWAVVEPSSVRSLIQLAGRVRRHRNALPVGVNVHLLRKNFRALVNPSRAAFRLPGFEEDRSFEEDGSENPWRMGSHDLADVLKEEEYRQIDSRPRILAVPASEKQARRSLVALEHGRTKDMALRPYLRPGEPKRLCAAAYLEPGAWRTGILQQVFPFRYSPAGDVAACFMPDEDGELCLYHTYGERHHSALKAEAGNPYAPYRRATYQEFEIVSCLSLGPRISHWGLSTMEQFSQRLTELAHAREESPIHTAKWASSLSIPGELFEDVRQKCQPLQFHPALGLFQAGVQYDWGNAGDAPRSCAADRVAPRGRGQR